jgi:hypothetical protein
LAIVHLRRRRSVLLFVQPVSDVNYPHKLNPKSLKSFIQASGSKPVYALMAGEELSHFKD